MKEGEKNAKRRKTEFDRSNSPVMTTSDSDECNTSYEAVSSPPPNTSVDNTEEEYIPVGTGDINTHHYSPARSRTSNSASGSSIKSSSRDYFSGDNSNSSDDSHVFSQSRDRYSDQDDVATEIVGRLSPDEYRGDLVDQSICNQEYSSSTVNKVINRINELKRSLPSSSGFKSTAAYVTQTFELRGTITTVAEQLSNSRQMEKSLKARLKQAVSEIEDLRDDRHSLRRDLHEANDALKKAEQLLAAKDDIINSREMELFIVRNDLELSKRAQLKAEFEKKQMELVLNAKIQYYENMQFHYQQEFAKPKISVAKPAAPAPVVFPANPQRYKYYAPNYQFNKKATATVSKESPKIEPTQPVLVQNATENSHCEGEQVEGLAGLKGETLKDLKNPDKINVESDSPDIQMESESSDFLKTEDEDCSTCRSESPVELIISAEEDDFDEDLSQKERFRFR